MCARHLNPTAELTTAYADALWIIVVICLEVARMNDMPTAGLQQLF